jgi:hypothetical protein
MWVHVTHCGITGQLAQGQGSVEVAEVALPINEAFLLRWQNCKQIRY